MKLTADDLAADIRRMVGNHGMRTDELAEALFSAGWSHFAGQQGDQCAAVDDSKHSWSDLAVHGKVECLFCGRVRKPERTCSDERPCIPCYSDSGECIGPYRAAAGGANRPAFRDRVSEIEELVASGKMNAYQCFTQMRQLISGPAAVSQQPTADAPTPSEDYQKGWADGMQEASELLIAEGEDSQGVPFCPRCGAQPAEPAVEATGTVVGYNSFHRTLEIWLDSEVPRWMIDAKIRVTISPTGGKSDA